MQRMRLLFWVTFSIQEGFFAYFFDLVFRIDFLSIFHRFRKGFGRVSGGQKGGKMEISGVSVGMCFQTLCLIDFCLIFDKIEGGKYMDFRMFFSISLYHLCADLGVCLNARNLKKRAPACTGARFSPNLVFRARC